MKNILSNWSKKITGKLPTVAVALNVTKARPMNEVIEEIHETFYTEVDRLLEQAKISKSLDTDKQDLIDKCNRLKALGFNNTKEVKEATLELERLDILKKENEENKQLIEAVNYFSFKYPNYKFITEDSVIKICEKYNLVYANCDKYIGTVPSKNIKDMENFKIDDADYCYSESYGNFMSSQRTVKRYLNNNTIQEESKRRLHDRIESYYPQMTTFITNICPIEIVAPLKDFDMDKSEVSNFKISDIEILDPVVLQPVFHNGNKHFLIVTAWGLEASDELVVNQKMN